MYTAILLAGGQGTRSGFKESKVLVKIKGKALIEYSIDVFTVDPDCDEIVLVVRKEDASMMVTRYASRVDHVVIGGDLRQDSVYAGLKVARSDFVFVHDGARPYVSEKMLLDVKAALSQCDAVGVAVPVVDTVKRVVDGFFVEDVDREGLVLMQTPQAFKRDVLLQAYQKVGKNVYTCDVTLVRATCDCKVKMVEGSRRNSKLTRKEDLKLLELMGL